MVGYRHLEVSEEGDVTVVRFVDHTILDAVNIQDLGDELFALVERKQPVKLLLNFSLIEFLTSDVLNKLVLLHKKVKVAGSTMKLCEMRPEIFEVFNITRLTEFFDIIEKEVDALATFAA